ncbi:FkbM family methyltransferase [Methylobacter sp. YRD-M1]|uniref:FkbM family methyltransferase n=1 Tax=Methylobacter sp. YRD-M1 TaxID=2911520 RepID=UPI00227BD930|nr:FkbM family methyltransferase [Methylobacter sp. YRD-M1]WAK02060.1 FkbM family methyltransferase [Methylobacter sp. YRD-M1]
MGIPINLARKLEILENLIPRRFQLPLRYYGQRLLGALEPEMKYLSLLVNPSMIAIDAGANKGIYSYALSRCAKHVYCFEPISELCAYIKNYQSNKLTVINSALSDETGKLTLKIPIKDGKRITTRASLVCHDEGELRQVDVNKLDSYGYKDVGFIKIDVEGAEEKVIMGGLSTIKEYNPVLLIEMFYEKNQSERCRKLFNFLMGIGYKAISIDKFGPQVCNERIFECTELSRNIIFVPNGHNFL